jgi:RNA polymerase sigma-32 factor
MRPTTEVESSPVERLYFRDLKKHKLLDSEQERVLACRFRLENDQEAFRQLVSGNLRLVVKIAKGFWTGNGISLTDLIQEGNIGLIQAARKFDPLREVKFSYYASFWIKAYINKYLMDNHRSVRLGTTQSQRKLFYNFKKTKTRLLQQGIQPTTEEISRRLNLPKKDVIEMQQRLELHDVSLNDSSRSRDHEELLDQLVSSSASADQKIEKHQFRALMRHNVRRFMDNLDSREQDILENRILSAHPVTLKTLGNKHDVSRERIRQLESRIIEELKQYLLKEFPEISSYFNN